MLGTIYDVGGMQYSQFNRCSLINQQVARLHPIVQLKWTKVGPIRPSAFIIYLLFFFMWHRYTAAIFNKVKTIVNIKKNNHCAQLTLMMNSEKKWFILLGLFYLKNIYFCSLYRFYLRENV